MKLLTLDEAERLLRMFTAHGDLDAADISKLLETCRAALGAVEAANDYWNDDGIDEDESTRKLRDFCLALAPFERSEPFEQPEKEEKA